MPVTSSVDPDSDPVLREFPVFMSKALLGQMYLVQYPRKPAEVSFGDQIIEAKIKPNQDKVQLKLEIDTETRYDIDKGEHLAAAAAGLSTSEMNDDDERPILSEHTMESYPLPGASATSTRYVAAVLRDGQIYLTPLKSIVQFRDTLSFLDEADENRKKGSSAKDSEDEQEATKITQKFTQARPGALKPRYMNTYNYFKKTREAEPWIELDYYTKNPEEFNKLFSGNVESDTPYYIISKQEYFEAIFPKHIKQSSQSERSLKNSKPKQATTYELKRLPLADQLRNIMINAKILTHTQLVSFLQTKLRASFDDASLLRAIQTVAVLVQGTWVVRSDLLYPTGYVTDVNGIPGPRMQEARELILCEYTKTRLLRRSQMCRMTHLPNAEVTEILSNLARPIRMTGWEFKYPLDSVFIKNHPEVAQRQATMWQMKEAKRIRASSSLKQEQEDSEKMKPPLRYPPKRRVSRDASAPSNFDERGLIPHVHIKQEKVDQLVGLRSKSRSSESD